MSVYMEQLITNRMHEAFKLGTGFINMNLDKTDEPTSVDMANTVLDMRLDYVQRGNNSNVLIIPVAQPKAIEYYSKWGMNNDGRGNS